MITITIFVYVELGINSVAGAIIIYGVCSLAVLGLHEAVDNFQGLLVT